MLRTQPLAFLEKEQNNYYYCCYQALHQNIFLDRSATNDLVFLCLVCW